jgi:branched-chain amino acid transport system permease protein
MSSRRSDSALPLDRGASPWLLALRANILIPFVVAAMWLVGRWIEHDPEHVDEYTARIIMLIGISIILAVSLQLINGIAGQFSLGHKGFMAVGAYLAGYPTATFCRDFATDPKAADPTTVLLFFISLLLMLAVAGGIGFLLVLGIRQSARLRPFVPGVIVVALLAWFIVDINAAYTADQIKPYLVWSYGISLLSHGFTSLMGHAQAAAPAINRWIPLAVRTPLTFLIALLGGGVMAAVAGLVVGLPTLRLRGDYLAIATLGFAEIIRVAVINSDALGKATGLSVPVYSVVPDPDQGIAAQRIFPWVYATAILTIIVVWRLAHSAKGRALQAVREDEIAAAAVGIDCTDHKVMAFVVGAFFAGVAGGLYAHYDGYLNPNSFGFMQSVEIVVMVTLGGLGSITGAVVAAIVLTWLPEFLRDPAGWLAKLLYPFGVQSAESLHLPDWLLWAFQQVGEHRMVFYSLLLIVMMILRPRGLLGGRELWFKRRQLLPAAPPVASGGTA